MKAILRRPAFRYGIWVLTGVIYLVPLLVVNGAVDYFLKIEGVQGESSSDAKHKEWIDISSFSFGVSNPALNSGATRTNGIPKFADVMVSKWIDKSTPILMESVCKGKVFPKVEIDVVSSELGTAIEKHMTYKLQDVLVSSFQTGRAPGQGGTSAGMTNEWPQESISLNFTKIEVSYSTVDAATGLVLFETNSSCTVPTSTP